MTAYPAASLVAGSFEMLRGRGFSAPQSAAALRAAPCMIGERACSRATTTSSSTTRERHNARPFEDRPHVPAAWRLNAPRDTRPSLQLGIRWPSTPGQFDAEDAPHRSCLPRTSKRTDRPLDDRRDIALRFERTDAFGDRAVEAPQAGDRFRRHCLIFSQSSVRRAASCPRAPPGCRMSPGPLPGP
jgi:hypothetical protein